MHRPSSSKGQERKAESLDDSANVSSIRADGSRPPSQHYPQSREGAQTTSSREIGSARPVPGTQHSGRLGSLLQDDRRTPAEALGAFMIQNVQLRREVEKKKRELESAQSALSAEHARVMELERHASELITEHSRQALQLTSRTTRIEELEGDIIELRRQREEDTKMFKERYTESGRQLREVQWFANHLYNYIAQVCPKRDWLFADHIRSRDTTWQSQLEQIISFGEVAGVEAVTATTQKFATELAKKDREWSAVLEKEKLEFVLQKQEMESRVLHLERTVESQATKMKEQARIEDSLRIELSSLYTQNPGALVPRAVADAGYPMLGRNPTGSAPPTPPRLGFEPQLSYPFPNSHSDHDRNGSARDAQRETAEHPTSFQNQNNSIQSVRSGHQLTESGQQHRGTTSTQWREESLEYSATPREASASYHLNTPPRPLQPPPGAPLHSPYAALNSIAQRRQLPPRPESRGEDRSLMGSRQYDEGHSYNPSYGSYSYNDGRGSGPTQMRGDTAAAPDRLDPVNEKLVFCLRELSRSALR